MLMHDCIFCKITLGDVSCHKVYESKNVLAFLDIYPLSEGHIIIIPKVHIEQFHYTSNEYLYEIISVAKRIALALEIENYNLILNNGELAGQVAKHVHFQLIPKTKYFGLKIKLVRDRKPKGLAELAAKIREKVK